MASDQKQLQLKSGEDKVKDLRRKLNAIASNREYQALLEQIAADEMTNSVLADEILEGLDKCDAFQKQVAEEEAALAAARRRPRKSGPRWPSRSRRCGPTLPDWKPSCEKDETGLPDDIRDLYHRIVRQKGEDALAAVENQYCGGCNQQVPLNLCSQIMLGQARRLPHLRPTAVFAGVAETGRRLAIARQPPARR